MTHTIDPRRLLQLLDDGDIDAALEAGLMDYDGMTDDASVDAEALRAARRVLQARTRLQSAWAARERHRQRAARLQRRADERQARRIAPPAAEQPAALPPAVAALLARAKARAGGGTP